MKTVMSTNGQHIAEISKIEENCPIKRDRNVCLSVCVSVYVCACLCTWVCTLRVAAFSPLANSPPAVSPAANGQPAKSPPPVAKSPPLA